MGKIILAVFMFVLSFIWCSVCQDSSDECPYLEAQKSLLSVLENGYKPSEQPAAPVLVNVTFLIRDVSDINEMNRYAAFLLTMRQTWSDPRLRLNLPESCDQNAQIPVNPDSHSKIWIPPTRLQNSIKATTVTAPQLIQTILVTPGGRVSFVRNFEVSFPCVTSYSKFPFDSMICDILVTAFTSEKFIKLDWLGGKAFSLRGGDLRMATHSLDDISVGKTVMAGGLVMYAAGVTLRRLATFYILQIFVPNILIVFVAWFSFLFPIDNVRISLLLSTLITSSIQYGSVASSLPRVGYLKGIDLWMLGCLGLIFFAMLEYSVLAYIMWSSDDGKMVLKICGRWTDPNKIMSVIDKVCKILYLVLLAVFVTCYFVFFVAQESTASASITAASNQNGDN